MDIKSQKGVTLTELIVTITIMAIIITPISVVFIQGYSGFFTESDKMNAQQCAREVLYGRGVNSYGIMGDLERCDNKLTSVTGKCISIGDSLDDMRVYSLADGVFSYNTSSSAMTYFIDPKVKIKDFQVNLSPPVEGTTDTTIASISITVVYGRSGEVTLSSSYRFPKLD